MNKINVTKPFLPSYEEYESYLKQIWDNCVLTNQGPLLDQLEAQLKTYLQVDNLNFVANGTLAIQLALHALGIFEGEIITTPFSYVATISSILWERCTPVFVDIDPNTFCIDASKIEQAITEKTRAILGVHVFGYPCDTDLINNIAQHHQIKVIYDAAHTMGVRYKGKALSSYGDVSTLSFHATKVFHTVEGGAVICADDCVQSTVALEMRFGHNQDDHICLGINSKNSEFHAAMGLANLPHLDENIAIRKAISERYDAFLIGKVVRPRVPDDLVYNYSYYPIVLNSEQQLLQVKAALEVQNIGSRRYFYPSLNKLSYLKETQPCPVSEDISLKALCLPLYPELSLSVVNQICKIILANL